MQGRKDRFIELSSAIAEYKKYLDDKSIFDFGEKKGFEGWLSEEDV
jgi:hypothetical protein